MGNTHSTQQPPTRERLILSNVENGYYNPNVKSNKKNDRQSSLLPYVPYKPKQTNKKTTQMLEIQQNPQITINNTLLVAKCSNFPNIDECNSFAIDLKTFILSTEVGKDIKRHSDAFGVCRFLKIYVTNNDTFYLMPLDSQRNQSQWIEESFTQENPLLPKLLSMIKRQKQLINKNGEFIFYVEFFLNRRIVGRIDRFHVDIDIFGETKPFEPTYISVTNISQNGYGLSTEIKSDNDSDNKSYTFLTNKCETVILHNNFLKHRSPALHQINESKYNNIHYGDHVMHQSDLTVFNTPIINELNENILKGDPRDLIRMLIKPIDEPINTTTTNLQEITHLVPVLIFKSPIVNYKFVVFDRIINNSDIMSALTTLKKYSIGGGKSKKKKYKKTKQKSKRSKSYRKSYKQRGGNVQDFAFYAEDLETSNLIENNVQIALDI
jgi:hypothetical protein